MSALQEKLHQACESGDSDAVRQTLMRKDLKDNNDMLKRVLLYRNMNGQSGLHLVCTNSQLANKKVISVINAIFECVEFHDILYELVCMKDNVNRTILHVVCENENVMILKEILICIQNKGLVPNNLTELALLTDSKNNTVLHLACKQASYDAFGEIFKFVKEDNALITKLLTATNSDGMTLLHIACDNTNPDITNLILDRLHATHSALMREILMMTYKHTSIMHDIFNNNDVSMLKVILKHTTEQNLLREMLMNIDELGHTAVHLACMQGHIDVIKCLEGAFKRMNCNCLPEICKIKDDEGKTLLHLICQEGYDAIIHILGKYIKRDHILALDKCMKTPFHLACAYGHHSTVRALMLLIKDGTLLSKLVKMESEEGLTPIDAMAEYGHFHCLPSLLGGPYKFTNTIIRSDNIGKLLLGACQCGNKGAVESIMRAVWEVQKRERRSMLQIFKDTDSEGKRILHIACSRGDIEILSCILSHLRKMDVRQAHGIPLNYGDDGDEDYSYILCYKDNKGRTAFHKCCQLGKYRLAQMMCDAIPKNDHDYMARIVCNQDNKRTSPLSQAMENCYLKTVKVIMNMAVKSKCLRKLLIECINENGQTLLHRASHYKHKQIQCLEVVLTKAQEYTENSSDEDYSYILCYKDNKGRTAFHKCCQLGEYRLAQMICDALPKNDHDSMPARILCNQDNKMTSPLSEAVENGYLKTVKVIMNMAVKSKCLRKLLIECIYENGQTLLHRANHYKHKQIQCLEVVLTKAQEYTEDSSLIHDMWFKADIYGKIFTSYLSQANEEILPLLIKQGIEAWNSDAQICHLESTLREAFDDGHHQIVKHIMDEAVKSKCIRKLLLECTNHTTLLHRACYNERGHTSCIEAVLNAALAYTHDPEVFRDLFLSPDENGKTFLYYLSDSSEDVIQLLLRRAIEWDRGEHLVTVRQQQQYICDQLLHQKNDTDVTVLQYIKQKQDPISSTKISALGTIFEHYHTKLDSNVKRRQPRDFVLFQKMNEEDTGLLKSMCHANCLELIQHEHTKKYLHTCWDAYARYFFFTNMVLYAMVLLMLTTFVVSHKFEVNNTSNTDIVFTKASWINPVVIMLILFSLLTLVYEMLQMITKRSGYIKEMHNYVDLIVCVISLCLPISSLHIDYDMWHHRIGAIVMCLAWVNATWMITRVPIRGDTLFGQIFRKISLAFSMLFYVMRRGCYVIPVFAMLTMTFTLCFHTLFQTQEPFSNIGNSLLKTIGMTVGELDMVNMFFLDSESESLSFEVISCILFVIFLYMMTISAMNLLVGMAVGDINELRDKGEVVAFETLVDLILESRKILSMLQLVIPRCTMSNQNDTI